MRAPKKDEKWIHRSGKVYLIICVTNEAATDRETFPIEVVYTDSINEWSRPIEEFVNKFDKA